jgi:hypothetical protein
MNTLRRNVTNIYAYLAFIHCRYNVLVKKYMAPSVPHPTAVIIHYNAVHLSTVSSHLPFSASFFPFSFSCCEHSFTPPHVALPSAWPSPPLHSLKWWCFCYFHLKKPLSLLTLTRHSQKLHCINKSYSFQKMEISSRLLHAGNPKQMWMQCS